MKVLTVAAIVLAALACNQDREPSARDLVRWMDADPNPVIAGDPCVQTYNLTNNHPTHDVVVDSIALEVEQVYYRIYGESVTVPAGKTRTICTENVEYSARPEPYPFAYHPIFYTNFGIAEADTYVVRVLPRP